MKDVDARHKAGHDDGEMCSNRKPEEEEAG
jgi:hypothetical protein